MDQNNNKSIDFIIVILKKWKLLFVNFLIVCIIAVIVSLLLPKWYRAKVTILPPQDDSISSSFSSMMNQLPIGALGLVDYQSNSDMFVAILKSRTIMEKVIIKF